MGFTVFPAAGAGKTRKVETLTSGSSFTVPAGVTYVNATLIGGGGGGGSGAGNSFSARNGLPGEVIPTTVTTTPGGTITYAIGAGGTGGSGDAVSGGAGGTTTFVGATSAVGGNGGNANNLTGSAGTSGSISNNGGNGANLTAAGGTGGAGIIIVEYWV